MKTRCAVCGRFDWCYRCPGCKRDSCDYLKDAAHVRHYETCASPAIKVKAVRGRPLAADRTADLMQYVATHAGQGSAREPKRAKR